MDHNREHLFNYVLFLRITPFLPNWFINITSPVINVPISPFFWGTFFGEQLTIVYFFVTSYWLMVSHNDYMSNDLAFKETGLRQVTCIVCERQLRLYGHVARLPPEDSAHRILSCRGPRS